MSGPTDDTSHIHPTINALIDREAAFAIETLARYVRPGGDWILTRSMLDEIDRGIGEIEKILTHRWDGYIWSKR